MNCFYSFDRFSSLSCRYNNHIVLYVIDKLNILLCLIGIEMKFQNRLYPVLIDTTHIPELNEINVTDAGLVIGSSVTVTRMEETLKQLVQQHPGMKE